VGALVLVLVHWVLVRADLVWPLLPLHRRVVLVLVHLVLVWADLIWAI
jgi:hypothetical protein